MWFVLVPSAMAWDLAPVAIWNEGSVRGVALRPGGSAPLVAVTTNDALTVRDPLTDTVLSSWDTGGVDVVWSPDGDTVVVCAFGGTYAVPWDGSSLGIGVEISEMGCEDVQAGETDVAVLQLHSDPSVWWTDGASWTPTTLVGTTMVVDGDTVVAASGAIASDASGIVYDFGAPVQALGLGAGRLWGSLGASIVSDAGDTLDPGGLASGDLDGDGLVDLLVTSDGATTVVGSLIGAPRGLLDLGGWAASIAAVGGSDCGSVAVAFDHGGYGYYGPVACHGDADGDGVSTEDGDCDDGDPDRSPALPEVCDAVDDNCDGRITDVPLVPQGPFVVDEGAEVFVDFVPCEGVDWAVRSDDPACIRDGLGLRCSYPDDGEHTVFAYLEGSEGMGFTFDVTVHDVPPLLVETHVTFRPGEPGQWPLTVDDPGVLDIHTFDLVAGPDWVGLSADGVLSGTAPTEEGGFALTIAITDDDGVTARYGLDLFVRHPAPAQECGCAEDVECSVAGGTPWFVLSWGTLIWIRRRPRGARQI